jgi:hypothetical protein
VFNWREIAKRNGASHCAALHIAHFFDAEDSFALCNVTEHNGNICFNITRGSRIFNVIFNQNGNVVSAKGEM